MPIYTFSSLFLNCISSISLNENSTKIHALQVISIIKKSGWYNKAGKIKSPSKWEEEKIFLSANENLWRKLSIHSRFLITSMHISAVSNGKLLITDSLVKSVVTRRDWTSLYPPAVDFNCRGWTKFDRWVSAATQIFIGKSRTNENGRAYHNNHHTHLNQLK